MRTVIRTLEGAGRRWPGRVGGVAVAGAVAVLLALLPAAAGAAPSPALAWSGSSDFGTIAPASTTSQQFTLTNTDGKASGAITTSLSGSSAFSITSDGCLGVSLGKGKSCQVSVQYAPANAGQSDGATLTASSKKLGSASVNLTGASTAAACTGVPVAVLDPSQGDVGYPTQVFNGANSYDPCGRPLLYGWDCLSTYDQQECSVINSDPSSPTETWTDTTLGDQITLGLIVCVVDPNATDGYPTPLSHPGYECSDEAGPYQYNAVVTTA